MSDRELLEKAAKATDIDLKFSGDSTLSPRRSDSWEIWNPLVDDGDALRLAVKLGFRIYIYPDAGDDYTIVAGDSAKIEPPWAREEHGGDPSAATRRAIVRAAAAITEQKEGGGK